MKTILIGAASLLLSGTALAGVPGTKAMDASRDAAPVSAKNADGLGESMIGNAITIDWPAKRADARAIDRKHIITAAKTPLEVPAAETPSTTAMSDASEAKDMTGIGGPDEDRPAASAAAVTTNYRACAPGPGDDSCIQLYEPGVREAYAAWQANGGAQQLAMGGPDEPAETAAVNVGEETAAYDPLPEDAVMPASDDLAKTELPADGPDATMAL